MNPGVQKKTAADTATVSVIVVSYNTRELTCLALRTLFETTLKTPVNVVVIDNASSDGSASAIAKDFPQVDLIRSDINLGFAKANNVAAARVKTPWLLLLNPDTECHEGAVDNLVNFAESTPDAGIWGGRTVFQDGSLNKASCWNKISLWSLICSTVGLSTALRNSEFFNPEAIGGWKRDSVRKVDIVVGCFLLIRKDLWNELDGFDLRYYMYGEEADLCLRAATRGYHPMITPAAEIMHIVGAASKTRGDKLVLVSKARATLVRDHWSGWKAPIGLGLMWVGSAVRVVGLTVVAKLLGGKWKDRALAHSEVWRARKDWLAGY